MVLVSTLPFRALPTFLLSNTIFSKVFSSFAQAPSSSLIFFAYPISPIACLICVKSATPSGKS
jgi:hypothetical protein